jgi:transcriptional regulator with GAF, ATPase, and Fis domain
MTRLIVIVFLSFVGIFVHPFPAGVLDFVLRFFIFILIIFLLFSGKSFGSGSRSEPEETEVKEMPAAGIKEPLSLENQVEQEWHLQELLSHDERTFRYLIDQFEIFANLAFPDNGWILLQQSPDRMKNIYYKNFTKSLTQAPGELFEITGLMRILVEKNAILMENNLKQESHLINFYSDGKYVPHSFLGIPILIEDEIPIYFVFDAAQEENFNAEDQSLYEKIQNNTTLFVLNRLKAYSLLHTLKIKEKFVHLALDLNSSKTITQAVDRFAQALAGQFEAVRLTISLCKPNSDLAVIRKVVGQRDEYGENMEFPTDEGLTGWVISKKKPYVIEDLEKGEYFIPRYSKKEKSNFGFRSFLGVPIAIADKVYGALTLEHHLPNKYNTLILDEVKEWVHIFSTTFGRQSAEIPRPADQ